MSGQKISRRDALTTGGAIAAAGVSPMALSAGTVPALERSCAWRDARRSRPKYVAQRWQAEADVDHAKPQRRQLAAVAQG